MNDWWSTLLTIQKVFYYFAFPSTVLLIIQTILTIIGFGGDNDIDVGEVDGEIDFDLDADVDIDFDLDADEMDMDSDMDGMPGFKFFTVRGLVAFFSIFGWTGATIIDGILPVYVVLFISVIAGLMAMLLIAALFYAITHLQSSGNVRMNNAIGHSGTVYIPIPPSRKGSGKIQVKVQDRLIEADAVTDSDVELETGIEVSVTDVTSIGKLVVEKTN